MPVCRRAGAEPVHQRDGPTLRSALSFSPISPLSIRLASNGITEGSSHVCTPASVKRTCVLIFTVGSLKQRSEEAVPPALDRHRLSCIMWESAASSLPSFGKTALVDKLVESRSRHLPLREPGAGHHLAVQGGHPLCVEQAETCQVLPFNHGRPRLHCRPLLHCCFSDHTRTTIKVCAALPAGTPSFALFSYSTTPSVAWTCPSKNVYKWNRTQHGNFAHQL